MYKNVQDADPPPELMIYNLCMLFHCLPSEIAEEDYEDITKIIAVHNTLSEVDAMRQEWEKKNLSADLGIALEIEKLKLQDKG